MRSDASVARWPAGMAQIDWQASISALDGRHLPCSVEERMLRLAASIAGGIPVSLRDTLTGTATTN